MIIAVFLSFVFSKFFSIRKAEKPDFVVGVKDFNSGLLPVEEAKEKGIEYVYKFKDSYFLINTNFLCKSRNKNVLESCPIPFDEFTVQEKSGITKIKIGDLCLIE